MLTMKIEEFSRRNKYEFSRRNEETMNRIFQLNLNN